MENPLFKIHQIIGLIMMGIGVFDLYLLPKILKKNIITDKGNPESQTQFEKINRLVRIAAYVTMIIGIAFFTGLIPLGK